MKIMRKCGERFNLSHRPSCREWVNGLPVRGCVKIPNARIADNEPRPQGAVSPDYSYKLVAGDAEAPRGLKSAVLFLSCGLAWAQSGGINPPQMGVMVDEFGGARPVFGVSASVTVGDPVGTGVLASACSGSLCVLKTFDSIVAGGVQALSPPGTALIAIDGQTALLYFPRLQELVRWQAGQIQPVALNVTGDIVALRSSAGVAQFAVQRNGATWIVDAAGQAIDSLPSASGPVLLPATGAIYTDGENVVLRRSDGSELRFPVPGVESFSAMSFSATAANYVQIRTGRLSYALRIDWGHERIFQLPEPLP
jgi:hypothetical protein